MNFDIVFAIKKHRCIIRKYLDALSEIAEWNCENQSGEIDELLSDKFILLATSKKRFYGVLTFDYYAPNEIHSLYIVPSQRRKGIGKALVERAIEIVRGYDCFDEIVVTTMEIFHAKKFYKKCGFKLINTYPCYGRPAYDFKFNLTSTE